MDVQAREAFPVSDWMLLCRTNLKISEFLGLRNVPKTMSITGKSA